MTPKVSVVMPVYNAGSWFRNAVDSVLAQTFRDFELILVDDGATDGSGEICDEYAARDSRVRVRHGRNEGICASRNAGMAMACGKWIAFCDHDDLMEADFLETLVREGERTGSKIVKCNHATYRRYGDGKVALDFRGVRRDNCEWTVRGLMKPDEYPFFKAIAGLVWDGIYLRTFVDSFDLRFDETFKNGGEDFDFMTRALAVVDGGVWVGRVLYRHFLNIGISKSASWHSNLHNDYLRTAIEERQLFPAEFEDVELKFASFAEWTVSLVHYVFMVPGCQLSLREQGALLSRYYDELVGNSKIPTGLGLPMKRRFLLFCVNHRMFCFYIVMKKFVVGMRRKVMSLYRYS